jgi:hypothetical protein
LFSLRQQGNAEPNNDQDNAEPINDQWLILCTQYSLLVFFALLLLALTAEAPGVHHLLHFACVLAAGYNPRSFYVPTTRTHYFVESAHFEWCQMNWTLFLYSFMALQEAGIVLGFRPIGMS